MNTTKGKQTTALKAVIYGCEGIGKSTLASQFPNAVFLDVERGTYQLDVERVDGINIRSWRDLQKETDDVLNTDFKTLVIDSLTASEELAVKDVLEEKNKASMEDWDFQKGWVFVADRFDKYLEQLNKVADDNRNIVLLAHSLIKKFELPDQMGQYDRYQMQMNAKIAYKIRKWADLVLFCNYKTDVIDVNGKKKAEGQKRVMYTEHAATWDAKNRFGLKAELPLDYEHIKHLPLDLADSLSDKAVDDISMAVHASDKDLEKHLNEHIRPDRLGLIKDALPTSLLLELSNLMFESIISEEDIKDLCQRTKLAEPSMPIHAYTDDLLNRLINGWENVVKQIKQNQGV